ncbi:ATP-binding protein [Polyangium sorediatum]|uniref:ATP-binding protein n=1 Tax=Polyangium sorediatum TaxID=889274 RepID=A0ABT6NX95_9BACT|nr:ATP-binding protein [Polyangium sorediatum]MDI1432752.1 ATP-binding protein [Polyangium sorediatum]
MRTFSIEGPCDPARHYHLPAAPRLAEALRLVDEGAYFLVRAPRRTGKTTTLRALAAALLSSGRHAALVASTEVAEPLGADLARVEEALLASLRLSAEHDLPPELRPPPFPASAEGTRIWAALSAWARVCPRPLVLFLDGADTLHGAALRTVLRQLEIGFPRRPASFPWSVVLAGQHDLRLEPFAADDAPVRPGLTGPFEIALSPESLRSFTEDEIRALYAQHTHETGQAFDKAAIRAALEATAGHPFLVQALGRELVTTVPRSEPIHKAHVRAAIHHLIDRRATPIDALAARLAEPRVRRVVEPLLAGTALVARAHDDDIRHARDLGLLAEDDPARIEGGIHHALVPRLLASGIGRAVADDPARFYKTDGALDVETLLHAFAVFYTTHARHLVTDAAYPAVAPELVFLGYLYRTIEHRGWVSVHWGGSHGRIDVTLRVPLANGDEQQEAFVLSSRRKGEPGVKARALGFLEDVLDAEELTRGTVVLFDRRSKRAAGERVKLKETTTAKGRPARVLRA